MLLLCPLDARSVTGAYGTNLRCAMLCSAMLLLFSAVPCYAMLCYAIILCCAMLCYAMLLFYAVPCYAMLCYVVHMRYFKLSLFLHKEFAWLILNGHTNHSYEINSCNLQLACGYC